MIYRLRPELQEPISAPDPHATATAPTATKLTCIVVAIGIAVCWYGIAKYLIGG